jgi:hypothetical protein
LIKLICYINKQMLRIVRNYGLEKIQGLAA